MAKYLKHTAAMSIFCFSICVVLLIDFCLPTRVTKEKIVRTEIHEVRGRFVSTWTVLYTDGGHAISVPDNLNRAFVPGQEVNVHSSLLLDVARHMQDGSTKVQIARSLYGNFIFAPIALLVISGLGVLLRKNIDYGFNFGVVSFMILLIMCSLLLTI